MAGLLHGERLEDYADRAGISSNTARSHLRSVFGKTDTSRQAELMRLMAAGPFRLDTEQIGDGARPSRDDAARKGRTR